jgi:hypothetical protein
MRLELVSATGAAGGCGAGLLLVFIVSYGDTGAKSDLVTAIRVLSFLDPEILAGHELSRRNLDDRIQLFSAAEQWFAWC